MHCAIPVVGVFLLALFALGVVLWCVFCFKLGFWIAGGQNSRRPVVHQAAAPAPANRAPVGGGGGAPRRPERPSAAIALILVLLLLCLAIFGFQSHSYRFSSCCSASGNEVAVVDVDPAAEKKPNWSIVKVGKTAEDAEQLAREEANDKVVAYVSEEMSGPKWIPTPDYVSKHLIKSKKSEDVMVRVENDQKLEPAKKVSLRVELAQEDQRDIFRRGRMLFVVKLLGALVLILAAVASYIRLDETTKGYYTGWLRLSLAGFAVAVLLAFHLSGSWF